MSRPTAARVATCFGPRQRGLVAVEASGAQYQQFSRPLDRFPGSLLHGRDIQPFRAGSPIPALFPHDQPLLTIIGGCLGRMARSDRAGAVESVTARIDRPGIRQLADCVSQPVGSFDLQHASLNR
ncbi:hypothetical protein NDR87_08505 [Nocardia sp. CDC159]|uniref:Uncharacterized protein n=1 Tax=Nocardia pulmonis TaxID=2951408 RepID=A0A9X2E4K2_9NOCA|nr:MULTISPECIES: hypothetical protein [Nocardia]MCM6773510.1 hypothetical protein [Nocardia pulmonis]MCM6786397.1 hypothetical protein [Nocardia sp. CDC159]